MADRDFNKLDPNFRQRLQATMDEFHSTYWLEVKMSDGFRTEKEQAEMVKKWASRTMASNHRIGKWVDLYFDFKVKLPNWQWKIYPSDKELYIRDNLRTIAHKYWLVNGQDDLNWGFDRVHFQPVEVQKYSGKITQWYKDALQYNQPKPMTNELIDAIIYLLKGIWKYIPEARDLASKQADEWRAFIANQKK